MVKQGISIKQLIIFVADLLAFSVGMICIVALSAADVDPSMYFVGFLGYFSIISACLFAVICCVDLCASFVIKTSTYRTSVMALAIFICCMLSPDYIALFPLPKSEYLDALTALLQYDVFIAFTIIVVFFFDFSYGLKMSRKRKLGYIAVGIVSAAVFSALYFVKLHYIAFFMFMLVPVELSLHVSRRLDAENFNKHSFRPTQFLVFTVCGLLSANIICSSGLTSYPFGTTTFHFVAVALTYAFIYLNFIRLTQKREYAEALYRARYESIKIDALQAQIKPHFVFNVLSSIKNLYHRDAEMGDNAIDLFSRHLRAQVDAANIDLIPLERELDNVQTYIELEGMRRETELNVVFDIEYSDFLIPALSLQPFIENAIKYSRIDEKPDGSITISSHRDDDGVLLEITDNGVGFDVDGIPSSSCGIHNSVERFRLLTGLSPLVVSSIGEGTSIKIRYDMATLEKMNENNHS